MSLFCTHTRHLVSTPPPFSFHSLPTAPSPPPSLPSPPMINGRKKRPIPRQSVGTGAAASQQCLCLRQSYHFCIAVFPSIRARLDYHFKRERLPKTIDGQAGRRAGSRDPWPPPAWPQARGGMSRMTTPRRATRRRRRRAMNLIFTLGPAAAP